MMFEHCDSHITKVVDLTVVFQRFGGTQIASWGPPDRRTDGLTHRDQSRPGPGPVWAGRRPAGCPPCAQDMRGHPVGRKQKVSRSRAASPPFTPITHCLLFSWRPRPTQAPKCVKNVCFPVFLLYPIGYSINLIKQVVFSRLGRDPHRKRELAFHGNPAHTKRELPSVTMLQKTSSGSYKTRKQ